MDQYDSKIKSFTDKNARLLELRQQIAELDRVMSADLIDLHKMRKLKCVDRMYNPLESFFIEWRKTRTDLVYDHLPRELSKLVVSYGCPLVEWNPDHNTNLLRTCQASFNEILHRQNERIEFACTHNKHLWICDKKSIWQTVMVTYLMHKRIVMSELEDISSENLHISSNFLTDIDVVIANKESNKIRWFIDYDHRESNVDVKHHVVMSQIKDLKHPVLHTRNIRWIVATKLDPPKELGDNWTVVNL